MMTNIKKEYKSLILLDDDYEENKEVMPRYKLVKQLHSSLIEKFEEDGVRGYKLDDTCHWKIVRWGEDLLLLPHI